MPATPDDVKAVFGSKRIVMTTAKSLLSSISWPKSFDATRILPR